MEKDAIYYPILRLKKAEPASISQITDRIGREISPLFDFSPFNSSILINEAEKKLLRKGSREL